MQKLSPLIEMPLVPMTSELDQLQTELAEKDELVAALTERLAKAAEQLDRLQRLGADRGLSVGGNRSEPQGNSDDPSVKEDVQYLVEQWDTTQPSASFGRLEVQVSEVRELIVKMAQSLRENESAPAAPVAANVPNLSADFVGDEQIELPDNLFGESEQESVDEPAEEAAIDSVVANWEAIKEGLLADEPVSESREPATEVQNVEIPVEDQPLLSEISRVIPDRPAEIDFDASTHEELGLAICERDEYISCLLEYILSAQNFNPDWEALREAPEEMQQQLRELQIDLENKLRLAEVSSAVERAKLGRDEARIRQLETNAQKIMKRLGGNLGETDCLSPHNENEPAESSEDENGGKWMRLLGLGKNEDS